MKRQEIYIITLLILLFACVSAVSAEDLSDETPLESDCDADISLEMDGEIPFEDDEVSSVEAEETLQLEERNTKIYEIGYNVTSKADQLLDFSSADDVLVITTAGMTWIDNQTTQDALAGIVDAAKGHITYGKGNILTLSAIRTDPTDIAFFVKYSNALTMAFYKNGCLTPLYFGTAGPSLTSEEWRRIQKLLGDEDAYSYVSIANAWANGMPKDTLTQATYHGHVCTGLISGQAMVQTLITYYPPKDEFGLPLENTAYYVLGVPGGSEDDAFTWSLDITPGKRSYIGVDTMVDKSMTGFIRWDSAAKRGIIIIMSYDETAIKQRFTKLSGLNPDASATNDIAYQNWLIKTLQNDPISLVTIRYELDGLAQDDIEYLMGLEVNKGHVDKSAHGLDMDYILSLNLTNATRETQEIKDVTKISDEKLKQIGIDASNMAIEFFNSQGITIEKGYRQLYVLTSAGAVRINNTSTSMVFDGITQVLGSALYNKTLLPVHTPIWKDLVFDFFWVNETNNKNTLSFSLTYDAVNDELIVTGNSSETANYIIQNALKYDPPYDVLVGWLFHNHVCGGSAPGYLVADFVYEQLPITNENETYVYITTNANCKDDVIARVLGVSPGMGTHYNLRYDDSITNSTNVGIAIRWNSQTKTGELIVISLDNWGSGAIFKKGSDMYEEYIKLYRKDYTSENLISRPIITVTARKEINEEMFNNIISGATSTIQGNSIDYIMSLDDQLPVDNDNEKTNGTKLVDNGGSSNSQKTGKAFKTTSGTYGNSKGAGSSLGSTPNSINANTNNIDAQEAENTQSGENNDAKSYEITKKDATKSIDSYGLITAILIVLILGAIVGYGVIRSGKADEE